MYTYSIATRLLFKRRISWIVIALVAVIVGLYLLIISVLEGIKDQYMEKIQSINAHVTADVGNLADGISRPEEWAAELAKWDPTIRAVTIGLETPAMAIFPRDRTIGTLRGIDLDQELKFGRLKEILTPAGLTEFGVHEVQGGKKFAGCIVGGAWRKAFGLKLNERVHFVFTNDSDEAKTVAFNIVGFYEGKNSYLEGGAYIDRKLLADLISVPGRAKTLYIWLYDPNRPDLKQFKIRLASELRNIVLRDDAKMVTDIVALLNQKDKAVADAIAPIFDPDKERSDNAIKFINKSANMGTYEKAIEILRASDDRLAEKLNDTLNRKSRADHVEVETWQEKDDYFYEAASRDNLIMRCIMTLFLAMVGFILFLIFGRLVAEKVRDIGALRALGASPGGILKCFLYQGLFIGVMGLLIGMVTVQLLLPHMNDFSFIRDIYPSAGDTIPYHTLNFDRVLIAGMTLLSAFLGAFVPAWNASRMNPVECLRHE